MVRFKLFLLLLILSVMPALAQDPTERLTRQLREELSDSVRFLLLLQLSDSAEYTDYEKCKAFANEAGKLADELGGWAKGKLYLRLAFLETMEGDYAEALKYDLLCAQLFALDKDSANLAKAFIDVGSDYRDLGEYDDAYSYFVQGFWIAKHYARQPTARDSLTMLVALHNMGTVFAELGQFDLAYQHLIASAKISEAIHDTQGKAYTQDELGELHRKKGDFRMAEGNLLTANGLSRKLKIRYLIPRTQLHLAKLYLNMGNYAKSLSYFDSVRIGQAVINNRFALAECDLGTGQVLTRLGNYTEALSRFQNSLSIARQLNARNLALSNFKALALLYEATKDYERSLSFHQQHDALRDSIFSKSTMEKVFKDQIRFQTMTKDLEIEALSQLHQQQTSEIRRQELIQNILVVVAVLSIILLYSVYRSSQRRKRINRLLMDHQEEIKKRSIELEQLNQVKDKFFSIISHDLRSPMTALGGTLDLLNKQRLTAEEFASLTQALRIQFNHTKTLINNLLDWTLLQMDKLNVQHIPVQLSSIAEEGFEALRSLYPKSIHFENRIDPKFTGVGDPNILSLVLRNLLLNAIKFTETGGRIWVEASERNDEIVVSVSDNGTGIQPEVQEFLFTKTSSYSTRGTANEKGTGLGLILCKEFVEKNGGRIWFESKPGLGSTFYFTLPKYKQSVGSPAPVELVSH